MLKKRGKTWWIRIKRDGKLIERSTGTKSKELARKIEIKVLNEVVEGKWLFEAKRRKLSEMIEKYESEHTSRKKHQARDRSIFKHLKSYFGEDRLLQDIERDISGYEDYRASQDIMPATIVKELSLLKRMFNIAIKKWRWTRDNPVSLIEMPEVKNERVRYLSTDEYNRLLNALQDERTPNWLMPIVVIALNTGLRLSNLLSLKWSQVNLFSRLILIEGSEMKNKESVGIPLTQEATETLKELQKVKQVDGFVFHCKGKRIYPDRLQKAFKKVCKIADITDFRSHDCRHSFASFLRQRGVDLHTISKLLGHKDTRMTLRYSHLSVENLREAISVLDKGGQKGGHLSYSEVYNGA